MRLSSIHYFLKDIKNRMTLSLKLMYTNRITVFVMVSSIVLTFFLLQMLNQEAKEKSSIPVGIVNLDSQNDTLGEPSELSRNLVQNLQHIDSISVTYDNFEKLYEKLILGEIYCLFVINDNYENKIRTGDFTDLVSVYQGSVSKVVNLLKDIVAGEMMFDVCMTKGSRMYLGLKDYKTSKLTFEQYAEYAKKISNSEEFNFSFKTSYVNTQESGLELQNLNNQLIYRQIIGAIFSMLLSFFVLFAFTYLPVEKNQGITVRNRVTEMNPLANMLGNLIAVYIMVSILCICFSGLLSFYLKDSDKVIPLFITSYGYVVIISVIFYILGKLTKSIFIYQLFGAIIVIVFGAFGLYSIVDNITMMTGEFYKYSPNSWFIRKIADIILY